MIQLLTRCLKEQRNAHSSVALCPQTCRNPQPSRCLLPVPSPPGLQCSWFLKDLRSGTVSLSVVQTPAAQHPSHHRSSSPRHGTREKPAPPDLPTTSWRAGFPPANLKAPSPTHPWSFYLFLLPNIHPELRPFRRSASRAQKHLPSQHLHPFPIKRGVEQLLKAGYRLPPFGRTKKISYY